MQWRDTCFLYVEVRQYFFPMGNDAPNPSVSHHKVGRPQHRVFVRSIREILLKKYLKLHLLPINYHPPLRIDWRIKATL